MDKKTMIQLPPIPAGTSVNLITAFWEFVNLSDEDQDVVAEQLKLLIEDRDAYEKAMKDNIIRQISEDRFDGFRSCMQEIISSCTAESSYVTALVAKDYFLDRMTAEEITDKYPEIRDYVESLIMVFQKAEAEDNDLKIREE